MEHNTADEPGKHDPHGLRLCRPGLIFILQDFKTHKDGQTELNGKQEQGPSKDV